jgi:hypothetical protein
MFELFLVAYPWDLSVEDVGDVLERLRGEVGITGLSLWVAAPPLAQLRAIPRTPRVFQTRGGAFFQPAQRHYTQTRCQPIMSSWVTMGSPLAQISKACAGRGLKLRAIVSAAAAGRMAERYPEFTCRNAFGDESHARLCLANAEVQTYLRAMALDLSSHDGVSALTLADFDVRWSDADGFQNAVPLGPVERSLLAVCFCESCRQRSQSAGIDVEAARRAVEQTVDEAFDHGPRDEVSIEDFFAEHERLSEHRRRQVEDLNSLLRKIKEACRCDLLLERRAGDSQDNAAGGLDLSIPSAVITRVDDPVELPHVMPSRARRHELRLAATSAVGPAGARLVRILPDAAQAGFAAVEIDHYGVLSESALTTLKQAIRFARRGALG